MQNFFNWFIGLNFFQIVFITYLFCVLLLLIPFNIIVNTFDLQIGGSDLINRISTIKFLIVAVIIAPLFETLIFQIIPIKIISKFLRKPVVLVFISSILFAFNHQYSIYYFFMHSS